MRLLQAALDSPSRVQLEFRFWCSSIPAQLGYNSMMITPLSDLQLLQTSAAELSRRITAVELSAVELTEASLRQVERINPRLNAICTVSERALDDARELDRRAAAGDALGPLHGLPIGIKDITETQGLRTTYGSPLYADHVPAQDAEVVRRIRAAGAVILGKTNVPEFAAGGNTFNEVFGATRNPWNPALTAGGSTGGGAAALASGMVALAEGTDLGGSLRMPASFCGVVGIRPSVGLVSNWPTPFAWDTLSVHGPMARTAEDVALLLEVMAGPTPRSPLAQPNAGRRFVEAVRQRQGSGLRLAYCPDIAGIGIDSQVERVCREAALELAQCGAQVEEIELDLSAAREAFLALRGHWMVTHHHQHLQQLDRLGTNVAGNIRAGLEVSTRQLAAAEAVRGQLRDQLRQVFNKFDHLLTPTMAVTPFTVEQNYPATVGGRDNDGMPVGLQIVGRSFGEEQVLATAGLVQDARPIGLPRLA